MVQQKPARTILYQCLYLSFTVFAEAGRSSTDEGIFQENLFYSFCLKKRNTIILFCCILKSGWFRRFPPQKKKCHPARHGICKGIVASFFKSIIQESGFRTTSQADWADPRIISYLILSNNFQPLTHSVP